MDQIFTKNSNSKGTNHVTMFHYVAMDSLFTVTNLPNYFFVGGAQVCYLGESSL